MSRGFSTVADLRARSLIDQATHCWHWQGAKVVDGTPRIWTFDYRKGEKTSTSGPAAVFMIAFERAPRVYAYRCCGSADCVNPAHVREAATRAAMGRAAALSGRRKGTYIEQRRANAAKAQQARGIVPTPPEVVKAIRSFGPGVTNLELAKQFGIGHTTVSKIRRGESRVEVGA